MGHSCASSRMMPVESAFSTSSESKCDSGEVRECSDATAHLGRDCAEKLPGPACQEPEWRPTPGAVGAAGAPGTVGTPDAAALCCRIEKDTGLASQGTSPRSVVTCSVRV